MTSVLKKSRGSKGKSESSHEDLPLKRDGTTQSEDVGRLVKYIDESVVGRGNSFCGPFGRRRGSDLSVLTSVLLPIECLIWMDVNKYLNMNNEENNIKFCGLVEQHRVLYDHTMSDYHNRNVSDRAWAKIAQILKTTGSVELTRVTEWPGIVIGELKIGDATGLEVIVNISIATAYNNTAVKMYLVSDQITDTMNEDLPIQLIVVKLLPGRTETATLCFQTHYKHSNPWQDWTDHTSRKYVLYEKTQVLRQQYTDEVGNLNFELTLYESAKDNYYPPGSAGIRYPERFSKQW